MGNPSTAATTNTTQGDSHQSSDNQQFLEDVVEGLSQPQKALPSKYFYDQRGSKLFEEICELDEYYPTRTELAIMKEYAGEMGDQIGAGAMLVEFGSGSSVKTRILLDHLIEPIAYVPVDVSCRHLHATADALAADYPDIEILPVCADFTQEFSLPEASHEETHDAVFFPGSTIGNFEPDEAEDLLRSIAPLCGAGGGLLIGIDLQKDVAILEAAYNDSSGVTAEFNLNLLHRINRELGGDIQVDQFRHTAIYNHDQARIEMYLESLVEQTVRIDDREFHFAEGERICTEYSHKYTVEGFAAVAEKVGLTLRREWHDDQNLFAVLHFAVLD